MNVYMQELVQQATRTLKAIERLADRMGLRG